MDPRTRTPLLTVALIGIIIYGGYRGYRYLMSAFSSLKGTVGVSLTPDESENREVFVRECSYSVSEITDTLAAKIQITNCWIERTWKYGDNSDDAVVGSGYQLVFQLREDVLDFGDRVDVRQQGEKQSLMLRGRGRENVLADLGVSPEAKGDWIIYIRDPKASYPRSWIVAGRIRVS